MQLFRRGKVWWMTFHYNSRRVRRSTETEDKRLANLVASKVITQIIEGKWFDKLPGEDKTLSELLDKYIEEYTTYNKIPRAVAHERSMKKEMVNFFGNLRLKDVKSRRISEYKSFCIKKGYSPSTIYKRIAFLRHAFNIAIREWEWVKDNPASRVTIKVDNARERWLTLEEERSLIDSCVAYLAYKGNKKVATYWLQEIVVFALNTGMRQGEILSLKWGDVDLFRKTATVVKSKNGEKRTIPLNRRVFELLKRKSKVRDIRGDSVFSSFNGTKIDDKNLRRAFKKAMKRVEIEDFRFHDLRHTFATRLVQAGVDLYKVSRLLGHKDIKMTQRYSHHYPESLRDGVEVLDSLDTNWSQSAPKKDQGATETP